MWRVLGIFVLSRRVGYTEAVCRGGGRVKLCLGVG